MSTPKWEDVTKHATSEIDRLHRLLEAIQPEATTNQLRGEIRALRRLLEELSPKEPTPPERMIQPQPTTY
jgi:hypothetical protein